MKVTDLLARSECNSSDKCPGTFYFPPYVAMPSCPICGCICHPENSGRNAGPALFHPKTLKPVDPWAEVKDG